MADSVHEIVRFFLNSLSFYCCIGGSTNAINDFMSITRLMFVVMFVTSMVMGAVQIYFTWELYMFYRRMPYRSIGCFRKTMVEVITVCAPLVLRHVVPYDVMCLVSLVGLTVYLLSLGQILHVAADINYWDMLLGIVMQILVYLTGHSLHVCSAILVFCGIVIFYRYLSYEAPITSDDVKKDLGDCPSMADVA
ncbi:uncharacterized protein LOC130788278 [Actinidia eriantha]|uniref:uncharacterized protein LOC130788278 n=1 Tax=Actinidia eriantha TaxID=165200 RepID=UPI00258B126F|nr:uncharacterized protein LOC130788278 [Actinidia eriantha]